MKRMELIANRSVENEIIEALEKNISDFYYTLLPEIHGKGKTKYRLGTATWPELNFLLISYLEDEAAAKAEAAVRGVKERFPKEGIKLFMMEEANSSSFFASLPPSLQGRLPNNTEASLPYNECC